ncbi:MAG: serine/threonine-protein phosphatase [Burkholderiales bacterium]|nr:serine/threonine-protein phosphatase [Burkholderiales bacterium]
MAPGPTRVVGAAVLGRPEPVRLAQRVGGACFELNFGHASAAAAGKQNEDFFGIAAPDAQAIAERGVVVALSDGVSGDGGGRVASEATVRCLTQDYYGTWSPWSPARALDRLLRASNDWLVSENLRRPDGEGAVCTLSAVVFDGDRIHLAHVGDTRIYRLRDRSLQQLTTDHTWPRRDMRHVLRRAVGLDTHLIVEYADGDLRDGDVFLLASDGVWEVLGDDFLRESLMRLPDPHGAARDLVDASMQHQQRYMGRNDATAVVVRVATLSA